MFKRYLIGILFTAITLVCSERASAQFDPFGDRDPQKREEALKIKEMIAKQQAAKDKKDHEELLRNGEQALELSNQLEKSLDSNSSISSTDKKRLESLEKLVVKIRKELGGNDEDELEKEPMNKSSSVADTFRFLRSTTVQLMDELKKTTRFTISAAAIETSNTLLRLTRFLRLAK